MGSASQKPSDCPADDAFANFVSGDLSGEEREQLLEHADDCPACHELLAGVLRGPGPAADDATLPNLAGPTRPPRPKPGDRIDHYVVVELVGAGAMGVVLRCRDTVLARDVALKILNRAPGRQWEQRLIREAQALAQLTHPNVVTVHAVAGHDAGVYVAMEYVRGTSLRRHLEGARRPWPEVVETFVAAGQGLAAAHAQGLVHRDFKPDNVLVSDDGRVLVTDFGLAAAAARPEPTPTSVEWSESLTKTGTALGTPRFMAPEQIRGGEVDPRADQFSFAVALYHGLFRRFPFRGATVEDLAASIRRDGPTAPPADTPVPVGIWEALQRALLHAPEDRFDTMDALLLALREVLARRRQRRRWLIVGGVGAAGVLGGVAVGGTIDDTPCGHVEERLEGVWDETRRAELGAALHADEGGEALFDRVRTRLDTYAQTWTVTAREICLATHQHEVQSPELLDIRMQCLDDAVRSLDALVGLLGARHEADVHDHAVSATEHLLPPEQCRNRQAAARRAAQEDPATRDRLAKLLALSELGLYDEAVELGESIVRDARAPGTRARARLVLAEVLHGSNRSAEAEDLLRAAGIEAAEAGDDEAIARTLIQRVWASTQRQRFQEGAALLDAAAVAVRRVNDPPVLRFALEVARGDVLDGEGQYAAAVEAFDAARDVAREMGSLTRVAVALSHRSVPLAAMGRFDDAVSDAREALAIRLEAFGELHPRVAVARQRVASVLVAHGRHAEAREELSQALRIVEHRFEPDAPVIPVVLAAIAVADLELGAIDRSIEEGERALSLFRQHGQLDTDNAISASIVLAHAYSLQGETDRALRYAEDALREQRAKLGAEHPALITTYLAFGEVRRRAGAYTDALADFERALAIAGTPSMAGAYALTGVGMCKHALRRAGAREALERAAEMHDAFETDANDRGECKFALAQAVADEDPQRALALAEEARALLHGPGGARVRARVEAFLAER